MAIRDTIKKPFIEDNNSNISIGVDLPIRLDNTTSGSGYFATTDTTIEAVKNNIRNLLLTQQGERLYHPDLGMNLRRYLFEPYNEEIGINIKNDIVDTFRKWLPFVMIQMINVNMNTNDGDISRNQLNINIDFSIQKDPNTLASINISLTDFGEGNDDIQQLNTGLY